jgi:hypothetical protein
MYFSKILSQEYGTLSVGTYTNIGFPSPLLNLPTSFFVQYQRQDFKFFLSGLFLNAGLSYQLTDKLILGASLSQFAYAAETDYDPSAIQGAPWLEFDRKFTPTLFGEFQFVQIHRERFSLKMSTFADCFIIHSEPYVNLGFVLGMGL